MDSVAQRFVFFKANFIEAKLVDDKSRAQVGLTLLAREESLRIVRYAMDNSGDLANLEEMIRDVRIFRSRLRRFDAAMTAMERLIADATKAMNQNDRQSALTLSQEAVDAFLAYRDNRHEFRVSLSDVVGKWEKYEKAILHGWKSKS